MNRSYTTQIFVAISLMLPQLVISHAEAARYSITFQKKPEIVRDLRQLRGNLFLSRDLKSQSLLNQINSKLQLPDGDLQDVLIQSNVVIGHYDEADGLPEISADIGIVEKEIFRPLPSVIKRSLVADPFDQSQLVPSHLAGKPWGLDAIKAEAARAMVSTAKSKVVVLDSGIEARHPQFGNRIVEVKDFTEDDDMQGRDSEGHGTHVAGTVAGSTLGVFPTAFIYSGKVCGREGCSNISIAQGLEWAVKQKVDVVNLSLGGGQLSVVEKRALDAAEAAGVTVVAASGNDGKKKVSFPAAYTTALAVGAVNNKYEKAGFSNWGPELDISAPGVEIYSAVPLQFAVIPNVFIKLGSSEEKVGAQLFPASPKLKDVLKLPIVFAGLGKAEDFKGLNLKGKVALIQRGETTFADKFKNALVAGASTVLFFNNETGMVLGQISPTGDELTIPVLMVEKATGEKILEFIKQTGESGGAPELKLSMTLSDFDSYSGTSMACPHVAGVAALMRAANPKLKPAEVRRIIMETSMPLQSSGENEVGAGFVDAEKAVAKAIELR